MIWMAIAFGVYAAAGISILAAFARSNGRVTWREVRRQLPPAVLWPIVIVAAILTVSDDAGS